MRIEQSLILAELERLELELEQLKEIFKSYEVGYYPNTLISQIEDCQRAIANLEGMIT